jgi:hypothetical protein
MNRLRELTHEHGGKTPLVWHTSRRTEQQLDYYYNFKSPQPRPSAKVVILDRENPPQPRSASCLDGWD